MSEHRNFLAARNSMHGEDEGTAEEGRNNVNDQASRELARSRYNTNGGPLSRFDSFYAFKSIRAVARHEN